MEEKYRTLLIYNPKAGKGVIHQNLADVVETLAEQGHRLTVMPTVEAGDAPKLMAAYGKEFDRVICCGGDGTLNEVASGMLEAGFKVPVGYIPAGTTNDFAGSVGLSSELKENALRAGTGTVHELDAGKFNGDQYFIYVAGFGAFTEVSYQTDHEMKNAFGRLAYILEGVKSLPEIHDVHLSYESEEESGEGDFLYGMITNSNSVGGFQHITGNDVELDDGLFEVTLIRKFENIAELGEVLNYLTTLTPCRNVVSFKTKKITLKSSEKISWTKDGEWAGDWEECTIENLPRALPLIL